MTTRYHQIIGSKLPPRLPAVGCSIEETVEKWSHIKLKGAGAPSFDIGSFDALPPVAVYPGEQKFPFTPMWLEFEYYGDVQCLYINEVDIRGAPAIEVVIFARPRKNWFMITSFVPEFLPKVGFMLDPRAPETEDMLGYVEHLTRAIYGFLSVLACNNVERVEIPAPAKLNKKRIKNGKLPISSHWTLVIKGRGGMPNGDGGGSHSSPRIHLRRGHIREYKPGNYTWVQPCVVGTNKDGIVTKDYKLEAGT